MNVPVTRKRLSRDIERAIASYVDCGYGLIRGFLSLNEITRLTREAEQLWRRYEETGPGNLRIGLRTDRSGKIVLDRLDPVADISEIYGALNRDTRFVSIGASGLREPVTVMKEKLTYRWPGTSGYGPHRDQDYNSVRCGVPGSEVLTVYLALDRANRANGAMEFFPSLRTRTLAAPAEEPRDVDGRELIGVESCMPEIDPGDVILFDGQVPHRSDWNRADYCRRACMISYVPARYPDARSKYYVARFAEQKKERGDFVTGSIFFE